MKKILLFVSAVVLAGMVNAQDCTPGIDNGAMLLGLNPNPPVGSTQGVPYNEVNTLVLPKKVDNTLTGPTGDSITLQAISILSVAGLPAGYTYEVWALNGANNPYDVLALSADPNNDTIDVKATSLTRACLRLEHPNPPGPTDNTDGMPELDSVPLTIVIGVWADLGFGTSNLAPLGGKDTFVVKLPVRSVLFSIEDEDGIKFSALGNNPNPAADLTYLNFTTPTSAEVSITVIDAVGRTVSNTRMHSQEGLNSYPLNTSDLRSGIYMYNLTYNGKTISKKMIVSK